MTVAALGAAVLVLGGLVVAVEGSGRKACAGTTGVAWGMAGDPWPLSTVGLEQAEKVKYWWS